DGRDSCVREPVGPLVVLLLGGSLPYALLQSTAARGHYVTELRVPESARKGPPWRWRCVDAIRRQRGGQRSPFRRGWVNASALLAEAYAGKGVYYLRTLHPVRHLYIDLLTAPEEQSASWKEVANSDAGGVFRRKLFISAPHGEVRLRAITFTPRADPI